MAHYVALAVYVAVWVIVTVLIHRSRRRPVPRPGDTRLIVLDTMPSEAAIDYQAGVSPCDVHINWGE